MYAVTRISTSRLLVAYAQAAVVAGLLAQRLGVSCQAEWDCPHFIIISFPCTPSESLEGLWPCLNIWCCR